MTNAPRPSASSPHDRDDEAPAESGYVESCFDERVLSDFHLGKLPEGDLEVRVARHLAICDMCASRLQQFPADPLLRMLQTTHAGLAPDAQTCTRIQRPDRPAAADPQVDPSNVTTPALLPPKSPHRDAQLPVNIDEYFVVRVLGEGGFGMVYLAMDSQHDRLVAVKVPGSKRPFTPEVRAAFLAEARMIATLDHPHIVRLVHCRELDDGKCILVMRYVEGQTLADAIKNRALDARRAAEVVAQIADALHYAHQRKVWHRDVKPNNIMLDHCGSAYLADFGLAVHADDRPAECEDNLAGTYPYMAPEQYAGDVANLDGRADIWSLGVVLYELLARRRPFPGRTVEAVQHEILNVGHRPLVEVAPEIDPQLSAICDRCLSKDVARRYALAEQLAADLRAYLAAPTRRRNRLRIGAGVAASLLLVTALVFALSGVFKGNEDSASIGATGSSQTGASQTGASQTGASQTGTLDPSGHAWRPLFRRPPEEITWNHRGANGFQVDADRERLTMRLDNSRGLVTFGELPVASFSVRYVIELDDWHGRVGFFWGLQRNQEVFPNDSFHCLSLNAFLKPDGNLRFEIVELGLKPSPFDSRTLMCLDSATLAKGDMPLPIGDRLALQLQVDDGRLVELRVNDVVCPVEWNTIKPPFQPPAPARFGFHLLTGKVTLESAALLYEEHPHVEKE